MANENIGDVKCPVKGCDAHIRKNKNGKLYVACEAHGNLPLNTRDGQEWILENGKLYGANTPAAAPKADDTPPAAAQPRRNFKPAQPATDTAPKADATPPAAEPPKKRSFLDSL